MIERELVTIDCGLCSTVFAFTFAAALASGERARERGIGFVMDRFGVYVVYFAEKIAD